MAMVVLYHCTCYFAHPWWPFGEGPYNPILKIITTFMGGIHLPVFVFISGYLYWMLEREGHYKNIIKFYKNKVLRLMVPYFFVGAVVLLIFDKIYSIKSFLYGICHLWFLLMLWIIFLLAPFFSFLFKHIKNDKFLIMFVMLCFFLYPVFSKIGLLGLKNVFYFFPFFFLGYLIQRIKKENLYRNRVFWFSFVGSFVILFILCPTSLFIEKVIREYASFIVLIIVSIILNFGIPPKIKGFIMNFSKNSMGIYLIHQIIICCVITDPSIKMRLDSSNSYLVVLVLFVGSLVSSWMLASLLNRFNITRFVIGSKMNV